MSFSDYKEMVNDLSGTHRSSPQLEDSLVKNSFDYINDNEAD